MLLKRLLDEMAQIDNPEPPPEEKTDPDFKVVGTLSRELQQLYTVMCQTSRKMISLSRQELSKALADESIDHVGLCTVPTPVMAAKFESDLIDEIFWGAVKLDFPELIGKESVAIRSDWQVGWVKKSSSGSVLLDLLRRL